MGERLGSDDAKRSAHNADSALCWAAGSSWRWARRSSSSVSVTSASRSPVGCRGPA